ncbi:hypothetical protein ASG87_00470 [Frateuria sp. Soil773]|uniref:hypothetical protein n=1 Tax=Frateuria sp. Soil773 TaxID=1736407 RepID=UPI0007014E1F|nr:hypothetical protein [Frateuria sp. Soil773]KRE92428.1 hypothetical protein ASG87_00470 [Frateuria sp. Soil773]
MASAPAIGFEYRPSTGMARLLAGMAVLAAVAVLCCGLDGWLKALLVPAIALAAWRAVRAHAGLPVTAAGWAGDGRWTLRLRPGGDVPATLVSHRAWGNVIWLRLHCGPVGRPVLLLAPDNSDADIRRRLRMRLAAGQAAAAPH